MGEIKEELKVMNNRLDVITKILLTHRGDEEIMKSFALEIEEIKEKINSFE